MNIFRLFALLSGVVWSHTIHAQPAYRYLKADSVAVSYHGHSLNNIKELSGKLTGSFNDEEEKFRAIYKWVCDNVEYDYELGQQNHHKRKTIKDPAELQAWNTKAGLKTIRRLIDKKQTVCTGYAYLVRELAMHAGLTCAVIDGYGRNSISNIGGKGLANHSWNAVKLGGQWFLCDPTWSSGAMDLQTGGYIKKYDESYFLPDPAVFIRNHYPLDSAWILMNKKPAVSEFLNRPLIYNKIYQYGIDQLFPEAFEITVQKGEEVSFRFHKQKQVAIKKIELLIKGVGNPSFVYPDLTDEGNGFYSIEHTFKTKGRFVVHFILDGNYVFDYVVDVSKN